MTHMTRIEAEGADDLALELAHKDVPAVAVLLERVRELEASAKADNETYWKYSNLLEKLGMDISDDTTGDAIDALVKNVERVIDHVELMYAESEPYAASDLRGAVELLREQLDHPSVPYASEDGYRTVIARLAGYEVDPAILNDAQAVRTAINNAYASVERMGKSKAKESVLQGLRDAYNRLEGVKP